MNFLNGPRHDLFSDEDERERESKGFYRDTPVIKLE